MKLFDVFSSFDEFERVLSHYKDKNYVDYYTKYCKTLASINAKFPNGKMVTASTKIKYYYIKYCCVHGGCHKKKKYFRPTCHLVSTFIVYTYFILYYLVTIYKIYK